MPDVGTTRVVSMPAVVVLPAPLGPSRPKISPALDVEVELVDRGEVGPRVDLGQVLGVDDRVPLAAGQPGRRSPVLMRCSSPTSYVAPTGEGDRPIRSAAGWGRVREGQGAQAGAEQADDLLRGGVGEAVGLEQVPGDDDA